MISHQTRANECIHAIISDVRNINTREKYILVIQKIKKKLN